MRRKSRGATLTLWRAERRFRLPLRAARREADVMIETPDGMANAYFAHPSKGAHAAVLIWPDIVGLRPAFKMMAKRLAGDGYAALVVNPYDRSP